MRYSLTKWCSCVRLDVDAPWKLTCRNRCDIEELAVNKSRDAMIIYHNTRRLFARGHRGGAVRDIEGAHLSKKSPPVLGRELLYPCRNAVLPPPFTWQAQRAMHSDDIEAIQNSKKVDAEGGCA